jgi:hypothetical protein
MLTHRELAYPVKRGELGFASVLSAKMWGFYDMLFKDEIRLKVADTFVMLGGIFLETGACIVLPLCMPKLSLPPFGGSCREIRTGNHGI